MDRRRALLTPFRFAVGGGGGGLKIKPISVCKLLLYIHLSLSLSLSYVNYYCIFISLSLSHLIRFSRQLKPDLFLPLVGPGVIQYWFLIALASVFAVKHSTIFITMIIN